MTQQHGLTWGALDFVDPNPADAGYLLEASADGSNFGNPKALIQTVRSLLTDGSLAVLEGWDNRQITVHLRISAPDAIAGPALAAGEAALMAELSATSKSPLVYTPVTSDATASYFDVVVAELERDYVNDWDVEETLREERYYVLTLTCLPFARPASTVVVPAIPVPPNPGGSAVFVNLDTCDATTNWAASYAGATNFTSSFAVVSGAVRASLAPDHGFQWATYPGITETRTGALSMSGNPYLAVDVRTSHSAVYGVPSITIDGVLKTPLAADPVAGGLTRIYVATGDFTTLAASVPLVSSGPIDSATRWLEVANVARTDTVGDKTNSTLRQQSRTATVVGSAPTQAAIRLYDATPAALGTEILVHTSRNTAWKPNLRGYMTSSATVTADTALVSGGRNTLASSMVFRIPASKLTEGTYALLARMSISTGGTFGWSAKMVSSAGATTVGSSVVTSGSVTVGVTSGYQVLNLAALPLPVVKAEADQMVELTLTGTSNMTVDEVWLFGLHDGVLTWLRDADSLTWIEIRSPELGAARPSIYGGTGAKGANSIDVSWKAAGSTYGSFGAHRFEPGLMQIFTVTSTSLVSQSEIEFYPRYHSHVTDEAA